MQPSQKIIFRIFSACVFLVVLLAAFAIGRQQINRERNEDLDSIVDDVVVENVTDEEIVLEDTTPIEEAAPVIDYPALTNPQTVTVGSREDVILFGVPDGFATDGSGPKKLIIALPGHGTTAKQGFAAWIPHLQSSDYGLAIVDWWNGTGETIEDYLRPEELVPLISQFLAQERFTAEDLILLEGFSRGSANTYAVVANEKKLGYSLFDGIIANAGSYQSSFPVFSNAPQPTIAEWDRYLKGTVWVLACGGKDPNPDRDGCPAMEKTSGFLRQHGANVLATLTDPYQGHGAFHLSSLGLPAQALKFFEQALGLVR